MTLPQCSAACSARWTGAEDDLIAQGRQARELQRDLLRTRMVEFEGIAERLYAVVRQAAKDNRQAGQA